MCCILLVEIRKRIPGRKPSARETAEALCELGLFPDSKPAKVEATIEEMENRGHRYLNLENALGRGVCFVLGTDLSESQYAFDTCLWEEFC